MIRNDVENLSSPSFKSFEALIASLDYLQSSSFAQLFLLGF